jgi:hypothetical protein
MGVPIRTDVRDVTLLEVEAWRAYDRAVAAAQRLAANKAGRGRSRQRRQ